MRVKHRLTCGKECRRSSVLTIDSVLQWEKCKIISPQSYFSQFRGIDDTEVLCIRCIHCRKHKWNPRIISFFVNMLLLLRIILDMIILTANSEFVHKDIDIFIFFVLFYYYYYYLNISQLFIFYFVMKTALIPPSRKLKTNPLMWSVMCEFSL